MDRHNFCLNPKKYASTVRGKLLGFMVTHRGIEVDPEKAWNILEMRPLTSLRDIQRLNGRLAALSRFMSKLAKHSLLFFEAIKRRERFAWTPECQETFEHFKTYLNLDLVISKSKKEETLYLYLGWTLLL